MLNNQHLDSFSPGQPPEATNPRQNKNRAFAEGYGATAAVAAKQYGPLAGDIAVCSQGFLGLITADEPQHVEYPDGSSGVAFVGIHLTPSMAGSPWSSRLPTVVTSMNEIAAKVKGRAVAGFQSGTLLDTFGHVQADCGNGFGQEAAANVTQGVGVPGHGYETPPTKAFRRSCI